MEAFRGDLRSRVFVAIGGLCGPSVARSGRVVSVDSDLTAFSNRLFVPFYGDRGYHRLAGETEASRGTVIEHVPLAVYLQQAAVGVVA